MINSSLHIFKRLKGKSPKFVLQHMLKKATIPIDYLHSIYLRKIFDTKSLLRATGTDSVNLLWEELTKLPYPAQTDINYIQTNLQDYSKDKLTIMKLADQAVAHKVNLLGSGLIFLGNQINWHKDYKSGVIWPLKYFRTINHVNPYDNSDVKIPWEISRMQWLIPVGQAYLITTDEQYANTVKEILNDWIDHNPYAIGVNWVCTMEPALRTLTWTWLFHVFKHSKSWQEQNFRAKFLRALYLHGKFVFNHLEYSNINGNHYDANAAGLVFAGLFFENTKQAAKWQQKGWEILTSELPLQVFQDGVDFEASTAYHRLVLELFFYPALYRECHNLTISTKYKNRLFKMANFVAAYSRQDGSIPLWGDADDGRALPLGTQPLNDHRYLYGLIGAAWNNQQLCNLPQGNNSEILWWPGKEKLPLLQTSNNTLASTSFKHGGFYIMRNDKDHVFIDCGPVGLNGHGGHGHNDCLSFTAALDNEELIVDCGVYVYTADFKARNQFRSTSSHNTPMIDNQEINRFIRWDFLWNLKNDALPRLIDLQTNKEHDRFCGSHTGYQRLKDPVNIKRTIILNHAEHSLSINDEFDAKKEHLIEIPLHFASHVIVEKIPDGNFKLISNNKIFSLTWSDQNDWETIVIPSKISPSYGIINNTRKIIWRKKGKVKPLSITIAHN
jgi:hypothetical protein